MYNSRWSYEKTSIIPKMGKCVLVNRSFNHFPRKTLSFQIIEHNLQVDQIFGEPKKLTFVKFEKLGNWSGHNFFYRSDIQKSFGMFHCPYENLLYFKFHDIGEKIMVSRSNWNFGRLFARKWHAPKQESIAWSILIGITWNFIFG